MASLISGTYRRFAGLVGEFARFGVVGGIGTVVDLGGAGYLHGTGIGPLSAKAISLSAATVITYVGNRFWAFRHPRTLWPPSRANQDCDFSVYGERAVVYDAAVFDNLATAICAAQHPTLTSDEHRR